VLRRSSPFWRRRSGLRHATRRRRGLPFRDAALEPTDQLGRFVRAEHAADRRRRHELGEFHEQLSAACGLYLSPRLGGRALARTQQRGCVNDNDPREAAALFICEPETRHTISLAKLVIACKLAAATPGQRVQVNKTASRVVE
jgi:hypothetical protein